MFSVELFMCQVIISSRGVGPIAYAAFFTNLVVAEKSSWENSKKYFYPL